MPVSEIGHGEREQFRAHVIVHRHGPMRPGVLQNATAVGGELARYADGVNTSRMARKPPVLLSCAAG